MCPLFPSWNGIVPNINRALNTLELSNNNIGGISWVNTGKLQGTSFKKGDTVQINSQQCIVVEGGDSDGHLKVQNTSGVIALAEALKVNRALTALDVRGNDIGDDGKSAIGDALLSSSTSRLQFLTCSEWSIKADTSSLELRGKILVAADAKLLAGVIKFNRALTSLDLWDNRIEAGGAEAIAAALPQS